MIHPDVAKRVALMYCMQSGNRYIECLDLVVHANKECLPAEFVQEVEKDYADYSQRMAAAGYPFKDLKTMEVKP